MIVIEKIDPLDIVQKEHLIRKINELIEEHNQLVNDYVNHYHTTLGLPKDSLQTTGPKGGGPNGD